MREFFSILNIFKYLNYFTVENFIKNAIFFIFCMQKKSNTYLLKLSLLLVVSQKIKKYIVCTYNNG